MMYSHTQLLVYSNLQVTILPISPNNPEFENEETNADFNFYSQIVIDSVAN